MVKYTQKEREAIDSLMAMLHDKKLVVSKKRRDKCGRVVLDKMERDDLNDALYDIITVCKGLAV